VHIKKFFLLEETVKRREETQMENFYYAVFKTAEIYPTRGKESSA